MRIIPDDVWAALTIWQEARGEPYVGKLAVAEVIRNRTQRKYSSCGSVASTVLWPCQFSGWNASDPNRSQAAELDDSDIAYQECLKAWNEAKAGSRTVRDAVLYHTISTDPSWSKKAKEVVVIGHHIFYEV